MNTSRSYAGMTILFTPGAVLLIPNSARAHCDGMDGPVVKAAQKALASGDSHPVFRARVVPRARVRAPCLARRVRARRVGEVRPAPDRLAHKDLRSRSCRSPVA